MAQSRGQWQRHRYAAACALACALLGVSTFALAAGADGATPAALGASAVPGAASGEAAADLSAGRDAALAMQSAGYAGSAAAAPQENRNAPQAATQDRTQGPSAPGDGPDATAHPGAEGILALHSDIKFSFVSAPRQTGVQTAPEVAFAAQVTRIAAGLQTAAHGLYPDVLKRIGSFDVYVGDSTELAALSSGSGKIVVNGGFARLNPTDDWLALVIAREMGHIVAGHHDSNSGASLVASVIMNLIVPGSGLIKSVLSFAGSQMASSSGHEKQVKEADEVAMKLLEAAGYTAKSVALNLKLNPLPEADDKGAWVEDFRVSARNLTLAVDGPQMARAPVLGLEPASAPRVEVGMARGTRVARVQAPAAPGAESAIIPAASLAAAPAATTTGGHWEPEELVRTRPSGLPGPLVFGPGLTVPARSME
jgi:hypothetical protein